MSNSEDWGSIIIERSKFFGAVLLCVLIDGFFLVVWMGWHSLLEVVQHWLEPQGFAGITSSVLRLLLDLPLLVLVVVFIVIDMKKVCLRIVHGVTKDFTRKGEK